MEEVFTVESHVLITVSSLTLYCGLVLIKEHNKVGLEREHEKRERMEGEREREREREAEVCV